MSFDHQLSPRLGQRTAVESPPVWRASSDAERPETPHDGQVVWRKDASVFEVYDEENAVWASTATGTGTTITGEVKMWLTSTAPGGYLLLQGQTVSRTTYAALFALWGVAYGAGDGSTTFALPDMRSRIPVGSGTFAALGASDALAEASRTPSHTHAFGTLAAASAGAHTHTEGSLAAGLSADRAAGLLGRATQTITGTVASGGAHAHTVSGSSAASGVPYLSVNFIVKT